jgi:hypothetical protein
MQFSGLMNIVKMKKEIAEKAKSIALLSQDEEDSKHHVITILDAEAAAIERQKIADKRYIQGGPSIFEQIRLNITFFVIARFSKI